MHDNSFTFTGTTYTVCLIDLVRDLSAAVANAGGDERKIAAAEFAFKRRLAAARNAREHVKRLAA